MEATKEKALRAAGAVAVQAHTAVKEAITSGVNVLELEAIAKAVIIDAGMTPAFLGYKGYPAATCIAVNDEIVHGIPRDHVLTDSDVVSVDLGVANQGWIVDTARTHSVGTIDSRLQELIAVTQQALDDAIAVAKPGKTIGDIGAAVEAAVKPGHFFIIKDLTGHGVGKTLQEPPTIPNHGRAGTGLAIKEGMVLAIEPIITDKPTGIGLAADGWTIVSDSGAIAAHIEDTIIVTENEPVILTR